MIHVVASLRTVSRSRNWDDHEGTLAQSLQHTTRNVCNSHQQQRMFACTLWQICESTDSCLSTSIRQLIVILQMNLPGREQHSPGARSHSLNPDVEGLSSKLCGTGRCANNSSCVEAIILLDRCHCTLPAVTATGASAYTPQKWCLCGRLGS